MKENQVPDWVGFGIAIDYNDQVGAGANGYYIGYPAGQTTGWFVERLGGDGGYPGFTAPDVVPGRDQVDRQQSHPEAQRCEL